MFPPFSYLLTTEPVSLPELPELRSVLLPDGWRFFCTRDTGLIHRQYPGDCHILIFGLCTDLEHGLIDDPAIADHLHECLMRSSEAFFEAEQSLGGRYVILIHKDSNYHILSDATGMMPVYYCPNARSVSSHLYLIRHYVLNDSIAISSDPDLLKQETVADLTVLPGTSVLIPNHFLRLGDFSFERFFPVADCQNSEDYDGCARRILELVQRNLSLLRTRHPVFAAGLTSGIDSRLGFAFQKSAGDISNDIYFTYCNYYKHFIDCVVSRRIAGVYGLKHTIIFSGSWRDYLALLGDGFSELLLEDDRELQSLMNGILYYHHNQVMVPGYRRLVSHLDAPVHIRSNLYEIGRDYYSREITDHQKIIGMVKPGITADHKKLSTEFFARSGLTSERLRGYNLLDFYYWEHRCGTWLPHVYQETDFAFSTFTPINCRRVLAEFLSVNYELRKNEQIQRHLLQILCPELDDVPVNPPEIMIDQHLKAIRRPFATSLTFCRTDSDNYFYDEPCIVSSLEGRPPVPCFRVLNYFHRRISYQVRLNGAVIANSEPICNQGQKFAVRALDFCSIPFSQDRSGLLTYNVAISIHCGRLTHSSEFRFDLQSQKLTCDRDSCCYVCNSPLNSQRLQNVLRKVVLEENYLILEAECPAGGDSQAAGSNTGGKLSFTVSGTVGYYRPVYTSGYREKLQVRYRLDYDRYQFYRIILSQTDGSDNRTSCTVGLIWSSALDRKFRLELV